MRKTIEDLIAADIWDSLVQFSKANIHNEVEAKLNWKSSSFNISPVGTPTYTAKKGWKLTTGKFLNSSFSIATQITAGVILEDSVGFLIDAFETAGDLGAAKRNGCYSNTAGGGANERFQLNTYSVADPKCSALLNCNTGGTVNQNDDVAGPDGVFYAERNAGKMIGYYNGIKCSDIDVLSSNPTINQVAYFGALRNAAATAEFYLNEYIRTIVICRYLGPTKQLALYNIIKYFNDNVGGTF